MAEAKKFFRNLLQRRQRIEDNAFRPNKGQRVVQKWIGFSEDDELLRDE